MIYGYARVSTKGQKLPRQIDTIQSRYPEAIILTEKFTGKSLNRPQWQKLMAKVKTGDTIVFDEVSRMSREAEEGFEAYMDLFDRGIELIFIKQPQINTEVYREALNKTIGNMAEGTDTASELINDLAAAMDKFMKNLARDQIKAAFTSANEELTFRATRQAEGIAKEKARREAEGLEMWGRKEGQQKDTEKSIKAKAIIQKHSRRADGTLTDTEVMKLAEISRGTFYKYVAEMGI